MYAVIIHYSNNQEEKELSELCNSSFINSISFEGKCIRIKTRKLWKLYIFNKLFKKFNPTFCYYNLERERARKKISSYFYEHYEVSIKTKAWGWEILSILFSNIHDVWKIRLFMFLR